MSSIGDSLKRVANTVADFVHGEKLEGGQETSKLMRTLMKAVPQKRQDKTDGKAETGTKVINTTLLAGSTTVVVGVCVAIPPVGLIAAGAVAFKALQQKQRRESVDKERIKIGADGKETRKVSLSSAKSQEIKQQVRQSFDKPPTAEQFNNLADASNKVKNDQTKALVFRDGKFCDVPIAETTVAERKETLHYAYRMLSATADAPNMKEIDPKQLLGGIIHTRMPKISASFADDKEIQELKDKAKFKLELADQRIDLQGKKEILPFYDRNAEKITNLLAETQLIVNVKKYEGKELLKEQAVILEYSYVEKQLDIVKKQVNTFNEVSKNGSGMADLVESTNSSNTASSRLTSVLVGLVKAKCERDDPKGISDLKEAQQMAKAKAEEAAKKDIEAYEALKEKAKGGDSEKVDNKEAEAQMKAVENKTEVDDSGKVENSADKPLSESAKIWLEVQAMKDPPNYERLEEILNVFASGRAPDVMPDNPSPGLASNNPYQSPFAE